jgi:hypothetical protein
VVLFVWRPRSMLVPEVRLNRSDAEMPISRLALDADGEGADEEADADVELVAFPDEILSLMQYFPFTLVQMAVLRGRMRYRTS